MKRPMSIVATVAALVAADAVTKELAERLLASGGSFTVIDGFFDLALVHNRGCAWGMFQGQVWPLAVFGIFALFAIIAFRKKIFYDLPHFTAFRFFSMTAAETLLYSGIIGNVIDRLFRGYVVDMFDFHWKNAYHYPCFNLADVYICAAAGILILASFFTKKGEKVKG